MKGDERGVDSLFSAPSLPLGLRSGDGVFETIRTFRGHPFRLDRHLDRLREGGRALDLGENPRLEELAPAVQQELADRRARLPGSEWILRIFLFASGQGADTRVEIEAWDPPAPPFRKAPISVGFAPYRHPGTLGRGTVPLTPVKWISRGPWAHSLRIAHRNGWEEALLIDALDRIVEGTRSNVVLVRDDALIAPGPESGALPGVTREAVLELARARGLRVEERAPGLGELRTANEAFLTSTLLGIAPISSIAGISDALQGETALTVTQALCDDFARLVDRECPAQS
jgi:branched-subunit amino acid aminotransferase/4-amino-4-deoxychorismate lyase